MPKSSPNPIVLYDGVCGLCNRGVQFLLKRDRHDRLRFASLQSDFADALLRRHGHQAIDLDTIYVVRDSGQADERLLARSDAVLSALHEIGGVWRTAMILKIVPQFVRDWAYNTIARHRYRFFGKYESCLLPSERQQRKFVDV